MNVGIVGLGRMGLPIAASLIEAGFTVIGYRRGSMEHFVSIGGRPASSSKEVAQRSDVVLTCVHEDALSEVISGESGLVYGAREGLIVLELSTASIESKERARQALQAVKVQMLDCPLSGTPFMAATRQAVLFASGDKSAYEQCLPVIDAFTTAPFYVGEFGSGMKMKFIANLLLAVHNLAAAEAMVLCTKAGLHPELVVQALSPSIASSAAFTTRALLMTEGRYHPASGPINTLYEVIELIAAFTTRINCPTPMFTLTRRYYEQAMAEGRGEQDIAAVFALLGKEAGLDLS